jgi:hypothetical protein
LIDLVSAGDAVGVKALVSSKWANWNQTLVNSWAGWIDTRGKLKKSECLGSKGASTFVRLVHERRSVTWTLYWKEDVLTSYSIDGRLPEAARYEARSQSEFVYEEFEVRAPKQYNLTFERDSKGGGRTLSLAGPGWTLAAKRAH